MNRIVLISGKQGSGKTTLQNNLYRHWQATKHHYAYTMNFADPLYAIHDFARNYVCRHVPLDLHRKDGRLLQLLGTEWGRGTLGDDIWIKTLKSKIENLQKVYRGDTVSEKLVIVGDCRFRNEFDAFPEALRVRLVADKDVRQVRCTSWRDTDQHQSEIDLDQYAAEGKFDLLINTGKVNESGAADLVLAQLKKDVWPQKRPIEVTA
jgi:RecA/RadA recombinase